MSSTKKTNVKVTPSGNKVPIAKHPSATSREPRKIVHYSISTSETPVTSRPPKDTTKPSKEESI